MLREFVADTRDNSAEIGIAVTGAVSWQDQPNCICALFLQLASSKVGVIPRIFSCVQDNLSGRRGNIVVAGKGTGYSGY